MKKAIRNVVIGAMCCSMVLAVAGCDDGNQKLDRENRPVALAIGALDENFNPFFYTAQNDGEVTGLTQISMLTSDANGNIVCGENEATVVLDYSETMKNADGDVVQTGDENGTTEYEFVIKNGIKDSMGYDITIKDVLFNLYVYLDPMYSGSSTIYSTKIKGLASYRAQQDLGDYADDESSDEFLGDANARIELMKQYDTTNSAVDYETVKSDIELTAKLFKEELESDWTSVVGTKDSYEDIDFEEDWQVYLFNERMIAYQYDAFGQRINVGTQDHPKYLLTIDDPASNVSGYVDQRSLNETFANALNGLQGTDRTAKMKEVAVDTVYSNYFINRDNKLVLSHTGDLNSILTEWATGTTVRQEILREVMSKHYEEVTASGNLEIKSISGIETYETSTFKGQNLGENHSVLKITIGGVDPAAIYNFAFTVAPLHYYSGTGTDGVDYVARADQYANANVSNRFGVRFANQDFFDYVIGDSAKSQNPVGAGPYKARTDVAFYNQSRVAYERNENFTTVGSGIENAKIKYLNYQYTADDQLLNSLINQDIDYGEPNCKPQNIEEIAKHSSYLYSRNYRANGFGYVGINPTYVPDMEVRQAIMMAMNPLKYIVGQYYTTQYSEMLYRPTSTTNFIHQYGDKTRLNNAYTSAYTGATLQYTADTDTIETLVKSAGWDNSSGVFTKNNKKLKLTFTIAGDTADHPAFNMFRDAAETLNSIGFDITVKTDRYALQSLATGKLAVWAAAWTSGIDPDMYQVYHKDSSASSVKNWGYPTILADSATYDRENEILTNLSTEIENARKTTNRQDRTNYYLDALDLVMDLAIELPTYQRHDLGVYNNKVIKASSLNQNPSANAGLINKIWELDYNID